MPLEVKGVSELVYSLGVLPAEVKKAMRPAILEAGGIIGAQAKQNAAFSSWIPGAVKVSASFSGVSGGAKVSVPERGYPHLGEVRVLEGNGSSPSEFRHPYFGIRDFWYTQVTHPFLHPALEQKRDEATAVIAAAVESVIAANGLGG